MKKLLDFFSFQDPNVMYVVIGCMVLAASSAIVGTFSFIRKKSLIGDAIAHAVLPGICLSFLIGQSKNPWILVIGAFITSWIAIACVNYLSSKTKIKEDTALGLALSIFFGIGILLLTMIQHSGNASQSGLDQFLFGKAASLTRNDIYTFSIVGIILIVCAILLYKEFLILSFDRNFAKAIGYPTQLIEFILTTLTVLAVIVGIQAVGVVLMAAMLITPAAAARFWTNRLPIMLLLAAIVGIVGGLTGAYISYTAPAMPTGPWIVLVISCIAILSFFVAPKKGIIAKSWQQKKNKLKILEENILKTLYHLGEYDKNFDRKYNISDILERRKFPIRILRKGIKRLKQKKLIQISEDTFALTEQGKEKGKRIAKLHRLWEVYLSQYLSIASDHVHEDAETMEHLITPEIEKKLEELLQYPSTDPHQSTIPY